MHRQPRFSRRDVLRAGTSLVVVHSAGGLIDAAPRSETAERKEIILPAAELAPADMRSDQPTAGKWWLRPAAGVPGGAVLLTGQVDDRPLSQEDRALWQVPPADLFATRERVPSLTVDLQVKGFYRVSVGLLNRPRQDDQMWDNFFLPARLWARLGGDPYPEYLMAPQAAKEPIVETVWRVADLTGQTLHFEQAHAPMQWPGRGWIGGIAYVKLTPLTDAEVAAARPEEELPPVNQRLFGLLDTPDDIFWWGTCESEEQWKAGIWRHQRAGFGRVYIRCWGCSLDNSHAVADANPRWSDADEAEFIAKQGCPVGWRPYLDLPKKFDILKVASDYARELGIEAHAWVRLTNLNRPPRAEFWHKHPEFLAQVPRVHPKTNELRLLPYSRTLSFAHPEVRAFYVSFIKQLASTGTPGILLDLLRHPPLAGFEPVSAEQFRKKYGFEMASLLKEGGDPKGLLLKHPQLVDHLADLFELFLRELRQEIGNDIEISVRSRGPDAFGLRGKEMVDAGLVDTIIDGNWYTRNILRPIETTLAAVGDKGRAFAIAEFENVDPATQARKSGTFDAEAILAYARHYSEKRVHQFGLYESNIFVWRPELRRAIRRAGWEFGPAKPAT
jgi:hypothetical protein